MAPAPSKNCAQGTLFEQQNAAHRLAILKKLKTKAPAQENVPQQPPPPLPLQKKRRSFGMKNSSGQYTARRFKRTVLIISDIKLGGTRLE